MVKVVWLNRCKVMQISETQYIACIFGHKEYLISYFDNDCQKFLVDRNKNILQYQLHMIRYFHTERTNKCELK